MAFFKPIIASFKCVPTSACRMKLIPCTRTLSSETYVFKTLAVTEPHKHVFHVQLNRPEKLNSMNFDFWREFRACFKTIKTDKECRAVVVSGAGKLFSSGLDFASMTDIASRVTSDEDVARVAMEIREMIADVQESFSSMEQCPKPVITAIHGACIGGALNLVCAADIRYCSEDAWFQSKEVDIGMAADVGTLQRFPRIVGNDSLAREFVYTGRKILSAEALKTYWNMTMLQSEDIMKAAMSVVNRSSEPPEFKDL